MDSSVILAELVPEPQTMPPANARPRTQFGIRSLLTFVSGISALFALMHLLGISAGYFLGGFVLMGGVAMLAIGCIELAWSGRQ